MWVEGATRPACPGARPSRRCRGAFPRGNVRVHSRPREDGSCEPTNTGCALGASRERGGCGGPSGQSCAPRPSWRRQFARLDVRKVEIRCARRGPPCLRWGRRCLLGSVGGRPGRAKHLNTKRAFVASCPGRGKRAERRDHAPFGCAANTHGSPVGPAETRTGRGFKYENCDIAGALRAPSGACPGAMVRNSPSSSKGCVDRVDPTRGTRE
jgi:hypothetical protein